MKKLMFAAALAAAMTSFADVSSANVVGYVSRGTEVGGNVAVGASFVSVGTKKVNLVDIGVNPGGEGAAYYCTVVLQTLKTDGSTDKSYYYIYNKRHGGSQGGVAGWYFDDVGSEDKLITRESGIEFEPGTGFWVQGAGKGLTLSGEVLISSTGVSVDTEIGGNVMVSNPYPFPVNLADIGVNVGGEGASYYCTVVAQTLKTDGSTDKSYYYIYNKRHGGSQGGVAGWYFDDVGSEDKLITRESNIILPAGGAYWVQGVGKKIVFPAFTLDK